MTAPRPWSYEIRKRPKVEFRERAQRGHAIYVHWWNPDRGKKGVTDKVRWPIKVRTADGKLDRSLVRAAEAELERVHTALSKGVDPRELRDRDRADAQTRGPSPELLTLEQGFLLYFDKDRGPYPVDTPNVRQLKLYRDYVEAMLGPDSRWAAGDADTGTLLSRRLAAHFPGDRGFRTAQRTVDLFFRAAEWLRTRKLIPVDACLRPSRWGVQMRRDWSELGKAVAPSKPRYTQDEIRTLLTEVDKADPRIRRALEVGAELRGANLLRVMRSDVDLDVVGGWGLGRMRVPGEGVVKRGTIIDIDPGLRERLDADMSSGDLAVLENRYARKALADYALFPGRGPDPINRRWFMRLFDDYEEAAGVEKRPGRGWYGLRRSMADAVEEVTEDPSVRNAAGAWAPGSDTREREYLDAVDSRLTLKTRQAVLTARRKSAGTDPELEDLRMEAARLLHDADREHVVEVLRTLKAPKLTPLPTPVDEATSA